MQDVVRAAESTLGCRQNNKKRHWFDLECEEVIKIKSDARMRWMRLKNKADHDIHNQRRTKTNELCKQKKQKWINETMQEIENENRKNNSTPLYKFLKMKRRARRP
ncbi:hypothetical protein ILUMI_17050 [Ignelater luminosus]|uniref:Uncharacterized protein n=1 Tax=Ignelater luminosus TaxID=2038154 RepID=A0A8K0G5E3_IGNLU|nr:hypothetical protein ILUMI_17050 [Ignelater luminosus]